MEPLTPSRAARPQWRSPAVLAGFGVVAAVRAATLPKSLWEWDEILFVKAIARFDPLHHCPHPPGYPLLVGLGKLFNLVLRDPFHSLVALSLLSTLVGYFALVSAFRRMAADPAAGAADATALRVAVVGAVLFHLSPAMLVYGPLALSDPPALMFLALALAAAARLPEDRAPGAPAPAAPALALGVFAAAAIGCRPQLALAVLPMLVVALWSATGRRRLAAVAAFTFVSLLWFVPLLVAVHGWSGLLRFLSRQFGHVLVYDKGQAREGLSAVAIATRFLAHPWGPRWTALPVLALAAVGIVALVRGRRRVLPLAVLAGVDLAFCLALLHPSDAVRYALPSLLGVSFAAAAGCAVAARWARAPRAAYLPAVLLGIGFLIYTWPLLVARTTTSSPPVQAAAWATRSLPARTIFLVDKDLAPHADYLLHDSMRGPVEPGLQRYAARRGTPVYLYGEGESGWPGAVTFRWPASDAYGKLTRQYYRVTSLSPIPPGRRYEVVRGVYGYEPSAREAGWRWLQPDAAIRLFPLGARTVALDLRLPEQAPLPANRVTIALDGTPVHTLEIRRTETRRVVLPLPEARAVEVSFRSEASFVPARAGAGADMRLLAVQLVDVEQLGR
jgi:transmembrane protein TMEM260 (protein O-mannosyltransferase)